MEYNPELNKVINILKDFCIYVSREELELANNKSQFDLQLWQKKKIKEKLDAYSQEQGFVI